MTKVKPSLYAEKDGDLTEQVDALSEYWASSAFSQTAVMLARN